MSEETKQPVEETPEVQTEPKEDTPQAEAAEQPAEKKKDQYRRNRREQSRAAPKAGFIIAVKTKTHAGSAPESEKYGAEGNLKQR